jgi:hypothetical protein
MSLESAVELLNYRFMAVKDYGKAILLNKLAPMAQYEDDLQFARAHPEHPLNYINRGERITGADEIRNLSESCAEIFTVDIIDKIHIHLSDCCANVRHSLVSALYFVGDQSSIPYITRLIEIESDLNLPETGSEMVMDVAGVVLCKLTPTSDANKDTVFVISPEMELVRSLKYFCLSNGMNLSIGNPSLVNIGEVPFKVAILDWEWLGNKDPAEWIDVLNKLGTKRQDSLLIVTLHQNLYSWFSNYVIKSLNTSQKPVLFPARVLGSHLVRIVANWMSTGRLETSS